MTRQLERLNMCILDYARLDLDFASSKARETFSQSTTDQNLFRYSSLPHTPSPALTHACSCTDKHSNGYNVEPISAKSFCCTWIDSSGSEFVCAGAAALL